MVHLGLQALIQRESARRLAALGGSMPRSGRSAAPAQRKEKDENPGGDRSIWIHHFRRSDSRLVQALSQQQVLIHPIVIGELATGKLRDRPGILADLQALPRIEEVAFTGKPQLSPKCTSFTRADWHGATSNCSPPRC